MAKKKTTLEDIGFGFIIIIPFVTVVLFVILWFAVGMFTSVYWLDRNAWFLGKFALAGGVIAYILFLVIPIIERDRERRKNDDAQWRQQRDDEALLAKFTTQYRALPPIDTFIKELSDEILQLQRRPVTAICLQYVEWVRDRLRVLWASRNYTLPIDGTLRSWLRTDTHNFDTSYSPAQMRAAVLKGLQAVMEVLPAYALTENDKPSTHSIAVRLGDVFSLREYAIELPPPLGEKDTETGFDYPSRRLINFILNSRFPFHITDEKRFENGFIVGARGTGKTELLFSMIHADLDRVARNECSVVVIDSQGEHELIGKVKNLKRFAKGGDLERRLVYLAPDPEYPLQLNIFDLGKNRYVAPTARERAIQRRASKELLDFVFSTFLKEDSKLTGKQEDLFTYVIELCGVIPNANLATLLEILKLRTIDAYHQQYVDQLSEAAQDFFNHLFNNQKEMSDTKPQTLRRVLSILRDEEFRSMFSAPKCLIDFHTLSDHSSVPVVNLDRLLMGETGTAVLGKFLMAMMVRDLQERLLVPRSKRHPVFMYCDECHDYCADNPKLSIIFNQGRKLNLSLFAATQALDNITNEKIRKELMGTACKFVKTKDNSEAATFARPMNTEAEFIANLPKYHFAMHIADETPKAVDVMATLVENPEYMTHAEIDQINMEMRRRFSKPLKETPKARWEEPEEEEFDDDIIDAEYEEVDPEEDEKVVYLRLAPPDPNEIKPGKRRKKRK